MCKIMKGFTGLKFEEKLATLNLLVVALTFISTIIIAYLGYSINSVVEERNKQEWSMAQAKNSKNFWKDIESIENGIFEQTELVGKDAGNFLVSTIKVLNEINDLQLRGKHAKINGDNIKLSAKYMEFLSAYTSLKSSIGMFSIKYDNSVLIYNPIVEANGIKGWDKYLEQSSSFNKWKSEILKPSNETFKIVHHITKTGIVPDDFENTAHDLVYNLSITLKNIAPPSLNGIHALKNANHPQNNEI